MSKQSKTLRQVDEIAAAVLEAAATEIRRLHAQRDALLKALKILVLATKDFSVGHYNEEVHDIALSTARAVIKQAEENT